MKRIYFFSLPAAHARRALLLLTGLALLSPLTGRGQVQTFTTNPPAPTELAFTATRTIGMGTVGYLKALFPNAGVGMGAFGVRTNGFTLFNSTTGRLDFAAGTIAANSGTLSNPNKLSFDLACLHPSGAGEGFTISTSLQVYFNIDGAGFSAVPAFSIVGPLTGSVAPYDFGGGTTYESGTTSPTVAVLTNGGVGISTVVISLPPSTAATSVAVRIVLTTALRNALLIDNVRLTSGGTSPLPVELTSFAAVAQAGGVALRWSTATERNNSHFDVQRGTGSGAFETIATVAGRGNSAGPQHYSALDTKPLPGLAYYRLRQVDLDGATSFSPIAAVRGQGSSAGLSQEPSLYPNPSDGTLRLDGEARIGAYRILNSLGQPVLRGEAAETIDVRALPAGPYLLELTGPGGRRTQRFARE